MGSDLASLMAVRLQGIATPERTAEILATVSLSDLLARGLVKERTGRLPGFVLEPAAVDVMDKLLADEGLRASEELRDAYDRFLVVNRLVQAASASSQTDGFDHGLDRLLGVHDKARACVRKIVRISERFGSYLVRLDACVVRLKDGDAMAFTTPRAESYHQVWWELHQDLLWTLDLEREYD